MTPSKNGIISIMIVSAILILSICVTPSHIDEDAHPKYPEPPSDFEPILRFTVASDVHVDDRGSDAEEARLKELFDLAYEYSTNHPTYGSLDGAFFVGDFSNRGTLSSMEKFFDIAEGNLREGTTLSVSLGNHEYYHDATFTIPNFLTASGYDSPNSHLRINGYHFILLSPYENGRGDGYDENCREWLMDAIHEAESDDESDRKPIFVFTHHPLTDTVYGSEDWGIRDLEDILTENERIVHFSGHSHFPINDPRSIWQGDFTALNTGTLSYLEMGLAGIRDGFVWPTDDEGGYDTDRSRLRDGAQFYIVEVDANDALLVHGFDIISGGTLMDPIYIPSVVDKEDFVYTDERKDFADMPEFDESSTISIESLENGVVKLRFPQAICDDTVQHYRVELYNDGELLDKEYRLSCSFYEPGPETLTVTFDGLVTDSRYTIRIFAVSPWIKVSEPLMLVFET